MSTYFYLSGPTGPLAGPVETREGAEELMDRARNSRAVRAAIETSMPERTADLDRDLSVTETGRYLVLHPTLNEELSVVVAPISRLGR